MLGPACPKATPARDRSPYWHQPKLQSTVTVAGAERLPAPSIATTSIVFTTPRSAYRIAAVRSYAQASGWAGYSAVTLIWPDGVTTYEKLAAITIEPSRVNQ